MADVALSELLERTRLESGLRNNSYYDTSQIIRYLNAGGSELYDLFTAANQKYVISEFDFTTTGQSDAVVDLPEDFQQGHSLEIYPDLPGQTRTIRYLSNWLNRNAVGNVFTLAPGGYDPVYTFLGNTLRFYPPQCTPAAPFRLYYTPQWVPLAEGVEVDFAIAAADNPTNFGGFIEFVLANAAATSEMEGGTLTLAFDSPNGAYSGNYTISQVLSATAIVTTAPWTGTSFTNPAAGTGNITAQPAGTRSTLPTVMGPWSEYLVVYAAMAINIDRQRPIGELERKLERLKARVASITSNRQEEPQQPPLTRGDVGWGPGWGGGGWGW